MVVQCPTCSSKFRIADEKVTDRGVRVRCTSCKSVFQVRKSGLSGGDGFAGDGRRPKAAASEADGPEAAKPASTPAPSRPPTGSRFASRPPSQGNPAAARRVEAEDLFGMAELTGDAPSTRRLQPATSKPAVQPVPSFDDIDLDLTAAPAAPELRAPLPPAPVPPSVSGEHVMLGAFKTNLKDPFEGMDMGEPGTGALDLATQPKKDKIAEAADAAARAARAAEAEEARAPRLKAAEALANEKPVPLRKPEPPKTVISAVLTGVLAAVVVIAVVAASALRGHPGVGWFGFGAGSNLVATRVMSGVYDTASGKPVFFVRGRVENHGGEARGPIRVIAEIVHDGAAERHAEALAGAEPTPEEVHSLKSTADAEKLTRSLDAAAAGKKAAPGASLPFFAVIAEPPQDLRGRTVQVRFETADPAKAR
ncbi:MAG TPA: zinc-ribbon domain-containing protein [Myxococcales bacterium]